MRINANACRLCRINASDALIFGIIGVDKICCINTMHLSRGTRNDVSGLNISIIRSPCSGFPLASNSNGSRRNARLRPPSFPKSCIALAPKGDPLCCGLSIAQSASIKSDSTSAMHGSKNSGLSESTQNSNVRKPNRFNSLTGARNALHSGVASFGKCGRIDDKRAGKIKHSSTTVSCKSCGSGPSSKESKQSKAGAKIGTTSR